MLWRTFQGWKLRWQWWSDERFVLLSAGYRDLCDCDEMMMKWKICRISCHLEKSSIMDSCTLCTLRCFTAVSFQWDRMGRSSSIFKMIRFCCWFLIGTERQVNTLMIHHKYKSWVFWHRSFCQRWRGEREETLRCLQVDDDDADDDDDDDGVDGGGDVDDDAQVGVSSWMLEGSGSLQWDRSWSAGRRPGGFPTMMLVSRMVIMMINCWPTMLQLLIVLTLCRL